MSRNVRGKHEQAGYYAAKVVEMIDLGMTGPEIATAFGVDARQR